jgi:CheY-like chemotaxis protein
MSRRLLLIDDPVSIALHEEALRAKYDVRAYSSAREALIALIPFKPDVLILDVGMAPVSALEFVGAVRAIAGFGQIPAIGLTRDVPVPPRDGLLAAGFQALVVKPILDYEEFHSLIEKVLEAIHFRALPLADCPS